MERNGVLHEEFDEGEGSKKACRDTAAGWCDEVRHRERLGRGYGGRSGGIAPLGGERKVRQEGEAAARAR